MNRKSIDIYMKKIVVILIIFSGIFRLSAQERLVISNATGNGQPCVWIKWYDEKVFYPEGVNIYRTTQSTGQRIKLNERPIKKGDYKIPEQLMAADTTLKRYIAIANEVKPADVKEFVSVLLIVKTLESNDFSKFCGIMYEDVSIVPGEAYSYELYELKSGQEKLIEKSSFLQAASFTPMNAPQKLEVEAGDSEVSIRWLPEARRYWGINIYRKKAGENDFSLANKRPIMLSEVPKEDGSTGYPDVFFIEGDLQNGVDYTYKIQGLDYFARPTVFSEEITVTPRDKTPPTAPNAVRAEVGLLDITLVWLHNYPSNDMKGYNIYRQKGRKGENIQINKTLLPVTQKTYYDTVPEPGVFVYRVAAVDSSGNEGISFSAVGEVLDIFPPAKPTGLQVAADTGRFILTWNPNTEKDLAGYRVYRTVGNNRDNNYVLLNAKPMNTNQFIDSLPKNAKNFFFYKVAAMDSAYNMSEYSDPRSSRMPDVIAPREPFIIGVTQETKALRIDWLDNAESDLMGYDIYRYQSKDSLKTLKRLNTSLIKAGMHLFTDYFIEYNTDYRYYLTAVDSSGNVSLPSVPFDGKFIADEVCPVEVAKLKASVKKNGDISLSWKVETKRDEGYSGCVVYRKVPQTNTYKALSTLSEATKYSDKFDAENNVYYYQVRAYGQNGCVVKSEEIEVRKREK